MGHYYQQTESGVLPRHFVEMSTRPGELRPTRITDVKKWWKAGEVVVPSVTTVMNVLNKQALINWKIDRHLEQAWLIGLTDLTVDDYIKEVKRLTELEMDKAPTAGTDFHKILEQYYLLMLPMDHELRPLCNEINGVIEEITGRQEWVTERNFVSDEGYGGQIDLSCETWDIDLKTKQTADKFKPGKMVYDEHKMQLAAYREGVGTPKARCANLFVCLESGEIDFHEHKETELERGWKLFKSALSIWQLQNGV